MKASKVKFTLSIFFQNQICVFVKNSEDEPISEKFQLEMNKLLDLHYSGVRLPDGPNSVIG